MKESTYNFPSLNFPALSNLSFTYSCIAKRIHLCEQKVISLQQRTKLQINFLEQRYNHISHVYTNLVP